MNANVTFVIVSDKVLVKTMRSIATTVMKAKTRMNVLGCSLFKNKSSGFLETGDSYLMGSIPMPRSNLTREKLKCA